ncbi:PREDICTED: terpene synthase 10-like [Nelumbo nucifera]|uniref:Terpene synthase 10-like n=2 Tax=Nelumbo nucifera TaxID=4432 RepID=A0A1U8AFX6_NELNU|nr:PREDICTED: terpene synthase 10-like [Nelumbo nucifera]DAD40088.1 TPA_asm: hypothetical protein HUJ06_014411 [Nelumbo nucifera]
MALSISFSHSSLFSSKKFSQTCDPLARPLQNLHVTSQHVRLFFCSSLVSQFTAAARRSGNYQPSIWDNDFVQSLKTDFTGERYVRWAKKLGEEVRRKFNEVAEPLALLELIDTVERLGMGYHFQTEIKGALETIISIKDNNFCAGEEIYAQALRFRLLRQHGFQVSQDVFKSFKEEVGDGYFTFGGPVCKDIRTILSLYEASYYAFEGESILDEAQRFTRRQLKKKLKENIAPDLTREISHAMELPLHWRMQRMEARWFLDTYGMREDMDPLLLKFAKLDFNLVQATHQEDLKHVSRWWNNLGLGKALSFSRDWLVECFLFTVGAMFQPEFGFGRRQLTKAVSLINVIDDVYDIYGSLDELQLFTEAVQRWDINNLQDLPEYMQICFMALYNTTNELAYDFLKEHGHDILKYLKKEWVDLCKAYLVEAMWHHNGYKPTLEEYMNNAWISVGLPLVLTQNYLCSSRDNITKEALEQLGKYSNIIRSSSLIFRFADDFGTSSDELRRGDVPKSIQCYMHDTDCSEEIAREHIRALVAKTWKQMNEHASAPFPPLFITSAVNFAQTALFMYQYRDGHGVADWKLKDGIMSLLVEPISLMV